jgi:hypothetical protein
MKKNATMMITGNSIAELRSNLNALEAAISSGARMGVGGTSLEDVKAGYNALCDAMGYEEVEECECSCGCCCEEVEEEIPLDPVEMMKAIIRECLG